MVLTASGFHVAIFQKKAEVEPSCPVTGQDSSLQLLNSFSTYPFMIAFFYNTSYSHFP